MEQNSYSSEMNEADSIILALEQSDFAISTRIRNQHNLLNISLLKQQVNILIGLQVKLEKEIRTIKESKPQYATEQNLQELQELNACIKDGIRILESSYYASRTKLYELYGISVAIGKGMSYFEKKKNYFSSLSSNTSSNPTELE